MHSPPLLESRARCCIAGGGPAGMMLGFLLARAGVRVIVLEKHADFLRDFRGDTIHPSTLELMYELGLIEDFLRLPHEEQRELHGQVGHETVPIADFRHVPTHCKFLAFMPQWDFLNFLAAQARQYPSFELRMNTEVTGVVTESGRVVAVRIRGPSGVGTIRADLVVGADGRASTIREAAGLALREFGVPIDVLWLRISRRASDPGQTAGRVDAGRVFVMLLRDEYWQCAFVIPKGDYEGIKTRGLEAFRREIARLAPFLGDRVEELREWDDVKLLTVKIDRLRRWHRPGVLCIGDAAHAMSPIGGVGINLAVQDAVAAANILGFALRDGARITDDLLHAVERRRAMPTRVTQRVQLVLQNAVITRVLASERRPRLPFVLRLLRHWPWLRRIPAYFIGIGVRPEHVQLPRAGLPARAFPDQRSV